MFYEKKSYAKVNIFLKIVATRGSYHEIISRFVKVYNLFDIITIKKSNNFKIIGDFGCEIEKNTIYKAYKEIIKVKPQLKKYLKDYKIEVVKNIPYFGGLGGGSSNAGVFLNIVNDIFELNLSKKQLANIGSKIGADISFFVYDYFSANVSGIGEIVEEFKEDRFEIFVKTNNILCETKAVFNEFRKCCLRNIDRDFAINLSKKNSVDILNSIDIFQANDLYKPALNLYPNLKIFEKNRYFFSGSGSSFFTI